MPRILSLKKIIKKKTAAHPNSRKSHQIQRAALRSERIEAQDKQRHKQYAKFVNRYGFYKVAAETSAVEAFTEDELRDLTHTYINRHKNELEELIAQRRPGQPKSKRQDALEHLLIVENSEFASGFKIPRMDTPEHLKVLKSWRGDLGGLQKITSTEIHAKPV